MIVVGDTTGRTCFRSSKGTAAAQWAISTSVSVPTAESVSLLDAHLQCHSQVCEACAFTSRDVSRAITQRNRIRTALVQVCRTVRRRTSLSGDRHGDVATVDERDVVPVDLVNTECPLCKRRGRDTSTGCRVTKQTAVTRACQTLRRARKTGAEVTICKKSSQNASINRHDEICLRVRPHIRPLTHRSGTKNERV